MRSLSIDAKSWESAQGLAGALSSFKPKLTGDDREGYRVVVSLNGSDRHVIAVLGAIEGYVTSRDDGPARVELDGRTYTLAPSPEPEPVAESG
jgi:hypothetical protein